jgi:hypothetical protein
MKHFSVFVFVFLLYTLTSPSAGFLSGRMHSFSPPKMGDVNVRGITISIVNYTSHTITMKWRVTPSKPTSRMLHSPVIPARTYPMDLRTMATRNSMTTNMDMYQLTATVADSDYNDLLVSMDNFHNMTYQVWYWSVNVSQDIQMKSTTHHMITLNDLTSGEIYNIWLMAVQLDQSQDLVTFQHRTSAI